jgi:ornithine cyclodeaminase/alanine dehydrogenase-like protein (mu-crystallin family)
MDTAPYVNKSVPFKFNGAELKLDLSHALFSSFDVDRGTKLLLKAAARDPVLARARRVLDEGCGVGVIGLGHNGLEHIRAHRALGKSEIVALCDRNPARLAKAGAEFGIDRLYRRRSTVASPFIGRLFFEILSLVARRGAATTYAARDANSDG